MSATQGLQRERRVSVGPVDLTVAMPLELAERVRSNPVFRSVVRPTLHGLGQLKQLRIGPRAGNGKADENGGADWDDHRHDPMPPVPVVAPTPQDLDPEGRAIIEKIAGHDWYHSIDLGHGVITPGFVDHRDQLPYYGLPASLAGTRVLDVATFDGFWAFEFDRRGAEVVAADIPCWTDVDVPRVLLDHAGTAGLDRPTGAGFRLADEILRSNVNRVECSVYDLDPSKVGMFDLVFISDLLVHLRDPQLALDRAYSVCRGEVLVADVFTPKLEGLGDHALAWFTSPGETWWLPNVAALRAMMTKAGFVSIGEVSRFALQARADDTIYKVVLRGEVPSPGDADEARQDNVGPGGAMTADTLLRKQKTIRAGQVDLTLSVPMDAAGRLQSSLLFRKLMQPSMRIRDRAAEPSRTTVPPVEPISPAARETWERICDVDWAQAVDLGFGVVTPGVIDHRDHADRIGLPESLSGKRVLDFGTYDGFWAFELERRGAEVVALDPTDDDFTESVARMHGRNRADGDRGHGFSIARDALGSGVDRIMASAYGLEPAAVGSFDLVVMSDVVSHLRCPQRAIESAAAVCTGELVLVDVFTTMLENVGGLAMAQYGAPGHLWWLPNVRTLANMMIVAGCEPVDEVARFPAPGALDASVRTVVLRGQVKKDPAWVREWRRQAEKTTPKWLSAEERAK